jgi:hypothetical protein
MSIGTFSSNVKGRRRRHVYKSTSVNGERTELMLSHTEPDVKCISDETARRLPQFIYRITCEDSCGEYHNGSEGYFRSLAHVGHFGPIDFFSLSQEDIKDALEAHLCGKKVPSHFISFTDCPITAICRFMQLREQGKQDIRFHVLDTTTIRQQVLIVYATPILKAYKALADKANIRQKIVMGAAINEVLVWDAIYATAASVPLQHMLNPGGGNIDHLMPELIRSTPSGKMTFKRPCQLRKITTDIVKESAERQLRYTNFAPKKCRRQDWAGRMSRPIFFRERELYDPRRPLDSFELSDWLKLAEPLKGSDYDLRLPWIISLLSTRLRWLEEETIPSVFSELVKGMWLDCGRPPVH